MLIPLAVIEPVLLLKGNFESTSYAAVVLGIQAVAAALILVLGMRTKRKTPSPRSSAVDTKKRADCGLSPEAKLTGEANAPVPRPAR